MFFSSSVFGHNIKNWIQFIYPPTGEWIDIVQDIHIMEYYSAIKNEKEWTDTMKQYLKIMLSWAKYLKEYILCDSIFVKL